MKRVLISGIDEIKYESVFREKERQLRVMGYDPINPLILKEQLKDKIGREPSRKELLDFKLEQLKNCYGIAMMPNYKDNPDCSIEYERAKELNLVFIKVKTFVWNRNI